MTIKEKINRLIQIIVGVNIILIICYLYCVGYPEKAFDLMKYNATLATISIGITLLINYYIWKIPYINKLFGSIPNIEGKWEAEIINTKDNKRQKTMLDIKQTWFTVQVVTTTKRGNSTTISSEIIHINDSWKLYFTWSASFEETVFNGTTIVNILDNKLDGYYFTNSNFDGKKCTSGSFKAEKSENV